MSEELLHLERWSENLSFETIFSSFRMWKSLVYFKLKHKTMIFKLYPQSFPSLRRAITKETNMKDQIYWKTQPAYFWMLFFLGNCYNLMVLNFSEYAWTVDIVKSKKWKIELFQNILV